LFVSRWKPVPTSTDPGISESRALLDQAPMNGKTNMPALSVPSDSGLHGDRLARHFGITATSALSIRRPGMAAVAMTRLRGSVGPGQCTNQLRAEAAFSIVVQLRGLDHHELSLGKRLVHSGPVPAGR
jgi:hypothetical protein